MIYNADLHGKKSIRVDIDSARFITKCCGLLCLVLQSWQ